MRDEFKITRQGKPYVLYAGLLDEAHEQGLRGIDTELVQVPTAENGNVAISKAVVEMEDGRTFTGIGDASPENVGRSIVPHIIRQSETRAKARALRDAVNVGVAALEELSDGEESGPRTSSQRTETPITDATPIRLSTSREKRSRDDELTPGGVPIWQANECIDLLRKAGHKREEVAPYIWKASPEAVEKKMNELKGQEAGG